VLPVWEREMLLVRLRAELGMFDELEEAEEVRSPVPPGDCFERVPDSLAPLMN
jgi:hypothetical protein